MMIRQRREIAASLRSWQRRLLRYRAFAVEKHSRIPCALHPTTYILNNIVVASGAWQFGKLDLFVLNNLFLLDSSLRGDDKKECGNDGVFSFS